MKVNLTAAEAGARMLEMAYLFGEIAPVYKDDHRHACRLAFGKDMADLFPVVLSDVGRMALKDPEAALPYVRFIAEAALYILGRGPFPATQAEPAQVAAKRVKKILKSMRLQELRPE